MAINISIVGDSITVYAPYHPEFPSLAKRLNGKWDSVNKTWRFDLRDEGRVRELCRQVYGTDGTESDLVTVRLTATRDHSQRHSGIFVLGRCLARASGRDSGARLGEGVIVIDGRVGSGGSVKNWSTFIHEGAILEVRDLPKAILDTELQAGWTCEIVQETAAPQEDPLTSEIEAGLARINSEGASVRTAESIRQAFAKWLESEQLTEAEVLNALGRLQ